MQAQLIALDWGTTSLRAYLLGSTGQVLKVRTLACGIMQLPGTARLVAGQWCAEVLAGAAQLTGKRCPVGEMASVGVRAQE